MDILNIGTLPTATQKSAVVEGGRTQNSIVDGKDQGVSKPERISYSQSGAAGLSVSRVSDATNAVLLRLQETGSVFDAKDAQLMNMRGVSSEDRQRFAEIVQNAVQNSAYSDPISYIKSLSSDDVEVLRRVHSLAETSGVTGTDTVEGAINLLLPPQDQVDSNNDGLVNSGRAVTFKFPPPNAPQSVKDAWDSATEGLSFEDKMMAEAVFFPAMIGANVKTDSAGNIVGIYEPEDPEYTNIFATTKEGWSALLNRTVEEYRQGVQRDPGLQTQFDILLEFSKNLNIESGNEAAATSHTTTEASANDSRQQFLEYMSMTPEERYYEALLAKEGLTKEELEALPPEERMRTEEKIQQKIEEDVMVSAGLV